MRGKRDFIRTIEAIYAVDRSESEWLTGILESSRPWLDAGVGSFGCFWQIGTDGFPAISEFITVKGSQRTLSAKVGRLTEQMMRMTPPLNARRVVAENMRRADFALNSEVLPPGPSDLFYAPVRALGVTDTVGINGRANNNNGVFLGAHLLGRRTFARDERQLYRWIARHLAAGSRLRRRLNGRNPTDAEAAAILTPGGRVEHVSVDASGAHARAVLRAAVLAMDKARGAERQADPAGAVRRWRVLVDARFSLLDRFESDGRRFVVACENPPSTGGEHPLTEREWQVVALYRLGADSKLIAYELGLADATVRVLLSRAARRLGVTRPRALRATPLVP